MNVTGMLHKYLLHVCMLKHAANMLLTHMQATSIPHMCSLHTYYYSAAYTLLTLMHY